MSKHESGRALRYYVGLSRADGATDHDPDTAATTIARYLDRTGSSSGCTILTGRGWWQGTQESSLVVYVSGVTSAAHEAFATWLLETFGQRAVAFEEATAVKIFMNASVVAAPPSV